MDSTAKTKTLTLDDVYQIAYNALKKAGANEQAAAAVAKSTQSAERDGISSHGLMYIPIYAEHLRCGKVNKNAMPEVTQAAPAAVHVDAQSGFAHTAIALGFPSLISTAKSQGIAVMTVNHSYNCGVLAYHTEQLAIVNLVGLGFTNAPASIAPIGGSKPIIGTNPFSLATPNGHGGFSMLIDQSSSVVAKSEIMKRYHAGDALPDGWVLDANGKPTNDPAEGLKGSMVASGGYKGVGVGLLVEVMAAALSGAVLGINASPFSGTIGGSPNTGQQFIAIAPDKLSGQQFYTSMQSLLESISIQEGAHIHGTNRLTKRQYHDKYGIVVNKALLEKIDAV
ncbi:MAG: Ldh family oxidoreductase [Ostreibacterium sp.]